jgi:Glycosyl hydrolase family 48/Bacterial Ig domain
MKKILLLCLYGLLIHTLQAQLNPNQYLNRFLLLRDKIHNPANGYFSPDGVPYHTPETLLCEAPDYGHESTSEAYSYWIWLEAMYGRVQKDWSPLNNAWTKMEKFAIPTNDLQPTAGDYKPGAPATYASEFPLPSNYPAPLQTSVPVGQDPVSAELTSTYGNSFIYGMHWLFDLDNFYGYGNKGDGVSTPSYINTFQRGVQESVWETVPQPTWEDFKWGMPGSGYLNLFTSDPNPPSKQWKYTNAPDADARVVQAMFWATQWAKAQGLNPTGTLPLAKAKKMGDYLRLAMFDKYFKPMGVQNVNGPGGTGYQSAHYLMSWYYAWGGPLTPNGWAWRIGSSHNHFGYQNPVAAYALSAVPELIPSSPNASRDWGTSLTRQLEFYQWLQSAEGAIGGGATNSWNGKYDPYPAGTPTFYNMAFVTNPVYEDPGSNTWFGFQVWSMERVAEYYFLTNNARAKAVLDKWITWAKSVTHLLPDGTYEIPSEIGWSGKPNTWTPAAPTANAGLHVNVVSFTQDVGTTAALAKTLTYYAAATQKYATLDVASRDLAKALLDRMWTNYYEPNGRGLGVTEKRGDFKRFFEQEVFIPAGWSGKMPNGDLIVPGVKFIDIRSKYKNDPDFPALVAAHNAGTDFEKKYHRFWAQADVALSNADYGFFFGGADTTAVNTPPTVSITAPVNNASFVAPANITITANAADANGTVTNVQFFNGTTLLGTDSTAPYSFAWTNVAAGPYSITAKATDNGGATTISTAVSLTVTGPVNTPPTVSITAPANNASFAAPANITITANAADANGTVTNVQFFNGTTLLGTDATSPYSFTWTNVAAGPYSITAKATDNAGAVTTSAAVSITVTGPGNTPPTVSITAPVNNASFVAPASITITANAADANGTVTNVQFFNGTTLLGTDATAPYSFIWTNVAAGTYSITARATDNAGATTTSAAVSVIVTPGTTTATIIGPDCSVNNTMITFELDASKRTNVTSYNWWYTGSVASITMVPGSPFRVNIQTGPNFSSGQVCVGTNLSASPWFVSYCKTITKCAAALSAASVNTAQAIIAPNPTQGDFTLSVSEAVQSYTVSNNMGTVILQGGVINKGASIKFGAALINGNYMLRIQYLSGRTETKIIQKVL